MENFHEILEKFWGYKSFRPFQLEIIESVFQGKDTLALLPTGGGKSICFQVPVLAGNKNCLVVSPLIALMNDQVDNLTKKNIKAMAITSSMNSGEIEMAFETFVHGNYKFLYVSPERLRTSSFTKKIQEFNFGLIAIDEAHCLSQWGYDFRPAYLSVCEVREYLPDVPILALTGSATREVENDLVDKLNFKANYRVIRSSFERKNLHYLIKPEEDKGRALLELLRALNSSSIVYARNRKRCEHIAAFLSKNGIAADFYHAGLSAEDRLKKQKWWVQSRSNCIVATNAFGMGIDKPDVRLVIHVDLPDSLEAYYQEAGRAGRDTKDAKSIVLFSPSDKNVLLQMLELSFPPLEQIRQVYAAIGNYYQIAIGSGEGLSVEFDVNAICEGYQLKPLVVFNSVKLLEKEGYWALNDYAFEPSRIMFTMSHTELYDFEIRNKKFEKIIKLLLRNYGGLYDQFVFVNENMLAGKLFLEKEQVVNLLFQLDKLEVLEYIPSSKLPRLIFTEARIDSKSIDFRYENYKFLKERAISRVNSVIQFVEEKSICRSRKLLLYFGEENFLDCGTCDNCLKNNDSTDLQEIETIVSQIKNLLLVNPRTLNELLSALYQFNREKVIRVIEKLQEDKTIEVNEFKLVKLKL